MNASWALQVATAGSGLLLSLLSFDVGAAQVTARIAQAGIYQLENYRTVEDATQPGGHRGVIRQRPILLKATYVVPLQMGTCFGVEVYLDAPSTVQLVNVRKVLRFPSPGLEDPETGKRYTSVETEVALPARQNLHFAFRYDKAWKLIPGEWKFEFWVEGDKIAEQVFSMTAPEGRDASEAQKPN